MFAYGGCFLLFFVLGFLMDELTAFRIHGGENGGVISYYAIYSLFLYSLGLGLWVGLEWQTARWHLGRLNFRKVFILLMTFHVILRTGQLMAAPKANGITEQTPRQEMLNTLSHSQPFWDIIAHGHTVEFMRDGYRRDW